MRIDTRSATSSVEDLPVAGLISTFAWSRQPEMLEKFYEASYRSPEILENICSGYRSNGVAISARRDRGNLDPNIALTEPLDHVDDAVAWHEFAPPSTVAMCRRRRIDVWADDGSFVVDAMFRDNTWEPDGRETVIHEYTMSAVIDASSLTLTGLEATPRVLPYPECPLASMRFNGVSDSMSLTSGRRS